MENKGMNQNKCDTAKIGEYLAKAECRCLPYVMYWVGNKETAEEICQDGCVEILKYMCTHEQFDEEDIMKLMRRIVKFRITNYFNKASTQREILTDTDALEVYENASCQINICNDKDVMKELLYIGIQKLRPVEKMIISGRLKGRSDEELAEALGKTPHAVSCIYSRTVKKLKRIVKERED